MIDPRQRIAFVWSRNFLLLWNRKIHNRVKNYLSYCILSHFEIDYFPSPFFKIHFNIIIPFAARLPSDIYYF
jgi:hypothetical protein